jgi:hypothetical protein
MRCHEANVLVAVFVAKGENEIAFYYSMAQVRCLQKIRWKRHDERVVRIVVASAKP